MTHSASWDGEQWDDENELWADDEAYPEGVIWDDEPQPAVWESEQVYDEATDVDEPVGRRANRSARVRRKVQAREARWQRNRLAVPYRTDGPKVTFGVLWFALLLGSILTSISSLAMLVALVAGLAGLQIGHAWFPEFPPTKWWTAAAATLTSLGGYVGLLGIAAGVALGLMVLLIYTVVNPVHHRPFPDLLDVLARAAIPVGIAAGSLVGLMDVGIGVIVSLVVLVSAYEVGDFLVGSGSSNAVEGPISGLVSLGAALFILWIAAPAPLTDRSVLLFGAVAAVCCPLGQILASGLLPRGNAWAPALRRLDSYLLAAPLWLVLLAYAPDATSL